MKKKLIATLVMFTLMVTVFVGCGGSGKDTIPLSEVIFSDEDVFIYRYDNGSSSDYSGSTIDKEDGAYVFKLKPDGKIIQSRVILGEVAQVSDEEEITSMLARNGKQREWSDDVPYLWNIKTDGTGNNTRYIECDYDAAGDGHEPYIMLGGFLGHIKIYDTSFMLFSLVNSDGPMGGKFALIRDTKKTIDKTVYLDEPGTDGFTTDGR